jgi:glycosyltransferase involved in cell wall biosynthesis
MVKAADTLTAAGYQVHVVSASYSEDARALDETLQSSRAWAWTVVSYDWNGGRWTRLRTACLQRAARWGTRLLSPQRSPLGWAAHACGRLHGELVSAALAQRADLYYGGTRGALAAAAEAARRSGVPYGLDLEDFHTGEQADPREAARIGRIEGAVLPGAAFLTAAGTAIAAAYRDRYAVRPIPVNNTFPLPAKAPEPRPPNGNGLRLYWFSQTIGPDRGLDDAVRAMGLAKISGELHLRGNPLPGYLETLQRLARDCSPQLRIHHHPTAPPDQMVDLCRGYDVGLALEPGFSVNNGIALSNKAFTYILAGLAVVLTDTPGQRQLARDLGDGAIVYPPGEISRLADGLQRWAASRPALAEARRAAWESAQRRWHWEHPEESGALLRAVAKTVPQ